MGIDGGDRGMQEDGDEEWVNGEDEGKGERRLSRGFCCGA